VGDILELAARYRAQGADELVFYDITASPEGRIVDRRWVMRVARILDIPFCVAGGLATLEEAEYVLAAGAEKVSVNSPALADPELIGRLARRFGSQCVVVGVDSLREDGEYRVHQYTGDPSRTRATGRRTLDWIREAHGAGARFWACPANLELSGKSESDLIPECSGMMGAASMIQDIMDGKCRVLTY